MKTTRVSAAFPELLHVIVLGFALFFAALLAGLLGAVCTGGC
jgi:hypothetical protein